MKRIIILFILSTTVCYDTYCNHVFIQNSECEAYFVYNLNPVNKFEIQFIDMSIGQIDQWSWQFGDGTSSTQQNPVHTYNSPGIYEVCLSIYNYDSLSPCQDNYCTSVIIDDTIRCRALFEYNLDSLSPILNTFLFIDLSIGNPDSWVWDFGDGNISFAQYPVHTYSSEGIYEVCLIIGNSSGCYDSICKFLVTPTYLNMGGFAYIGNKPMNNPIHEGDTGTAYLFRHNSPTSVYLVDSCKFYEYGYYWS